jgi:hypothetical protein
VFASATSEPSAVATLSAARSCAACRVHRSVGPRDVRQVGEDAGSGRWRGSLEREVRGGACQRDVAGREPGKGFMNAGLGDGIARPRRKSGGDGEEAGGGRRRSASEGDLGPLRDRWFVLGGERRQAGEVASANLGVGGLARQSQVDLAPGGCSREGFGDRGDEGMARADDAAILFEEASRLSLAKRVAERRSDGSLQQLQGRPSGQRDNEDDFSSLRRQVFESSGDEGPDAVRHGERIFLQEARSAIGHRAPQLEGGERVAAGCLSDPEERASRELETERAAQQVMDRRERQRRRHDRDEALGIEGSPEPEGIRSPLALPDRDGHREPARRSIERERQRPGGVGIQPLGIVDGDQQRTFLRKSLDDDRGRGCDQAAVGAVVR